MANYVERDGEILPSYTGVNQPRYLVHDEGLPHDFSTSPTTDEAPEEEPQQELELIQEDGGASANSAENPYWLSPDKRARIATIIRQGQKERAERLGRP